MQGVFVPIAEDRSCLTSSAPSQPCCYRWRRELHTPLMKPYLGIFRDEKFYE